MDPEEKAAKDAEVRKEAEKLASKQGPGPDFTMGGPKRKTAEYFMPKQGRSSKNDTRKLR